METFGEHFDVFEVTPATARTMQLFHSRDFVDALYKSRDACPREEFGLVDDCCAFRGVFELASLEAGGSVQVRLIRRAGGLGEDVANLRFELGLVESGLVYRPLGAER